MPTSPCGRQSFWLTSSANHLVRLEEEGWRNRQAERFRRLEIDHQLELHGLLYGEVGWFGTLQDVVHVSGSAIFPWYDWQTLKGVMGIDGTKTPTLYALRLMMRGLQGEDPLSGGARYPQPGGYRAHYDRG